ncbi:hypothetical protein ACFX2I_023745 [Malus domestica]
MNEARGKTATAVHSGHHDHKRRRTSMIAVKRLADHEASNKRRRTSMIAVKRLADHEARRLTFCALGIDSLHRSAVLLLLAGPVGFVFSSSTHHLNL